MTENPITVETAEIIQKDNSPFVANENGSYQLPIKILARNVVLDMNVIVNPPSEEDRIVKQVVYQLPENFVGVNGNRTVSCNREVLDTEQTVLLFDMLRTKEVIGRYTNESLAYLVNVLTGYSRKCLQEDFSYIRNLLKFKKGKQNVENLQVLKRFFLSLADECEAMIKDYAK